MSSKVTPRRPSGAGRAPRGYEARDERPAKKSKSARPEPEYYDDYEDGFYEDDFYEDDFYEDDSYREERPAPPKKKASRKPREALLPFGDDGYARVKRPARDGAAYEARPRRGAREEEERPARKPRAAAQRPARKVRPIDGDYPVRSARGYDEELPVRKKARAQGARPADFDRRMDDFYEYDRPVRKAPAKSRKKKKKEKSAASAFLYWAIAIVLALLIGFGVRTFFFELIRVNSDAMGMTLSQGETVLVQKSVYYTAKPARGDIVCVNSPDGLLIRRVVALPGETIEIKDGVTYVNDEALDEPYISQAGGGDYPLTIIPDGGYFVMGDNRLNTDDSRTFGLIKNTRSLIVGRVNSVVWPLDQWGDIE